MKQLHLMGLLLCAAVLTGCQGSMTPGKMAWVQPHSEQPRAGNAYLLRGFIGLFSHGIDELTETINASGVRAHVYQDDQFKALGYEIAKKYKDQKDPEPLILIGHSYGADDVVRVAKICNEAGVKVDLLITMDPVTPPDVPGNVKLAYNFYQPSMWDITPVLRGIALTKVEGTDTVLHNLNLRSERKDLLEKGQNHINIEKNKRIHREVIDYVLTLCPPRDQWVAARNLEAQPAATSVQPNVPQTAAQTEVPVTAR